MKILSLSLDSSIVNKQSDLSRRTLGYGVLVEKYIVIVPADKNEKIDLSDKVKIFAVGGRGKFLKLFRIYGLSKDILRQEKFDVITVQDQYYLALLGWCLAGKYQAGLEVQVHGWEKYRGLRKFIARYVLPRADAVRCVSQRLKEQLVNDLGVAEERITVVPIYVEKSQILNPKSQNLDNTAKNKFIFMTVGRLVPVKNIGLQIEAMAEIVKKHPRAELWIVGDGPERENLKFKINNLKLGDRVKLSGQKSRQELAALYEQADVFILSSSSEGWGLAAIEAAGYGLPVIMTDVGCAGEIIINNESGIVIPAGDKVSLIKAMEKVMQDEASRQRIGEGARRAVQALPSKQETLSRYLASWQKAAGLK